MKTGFFFFFVSVKYQKIAFDVVVDLQEDQATGPVQKRRVQRGAGQRVETAAAVPAGPVHHAGGRAMAVDAVGVLRELPAQLARIRRRLVPDRVHARRPVAGKRGRPAMVAVRDQHADVRRQFPVQRGDAAHHRLRLPHGHRTVLRSHHVVLLPEHRRTHDTSTRVSEHIQTPKIFLSHVFHPY